MHKTDDSWSWQAIRRQLKNIKCLDYFFIPFVLGPTYYIYRTLDLLQKKSSMYIEESDNFISSSCNYPEYFLSSVSTIYQSQCIETFTAKIFPAITKKLLQCTYLVSPFSPILSKLILTYPNIVENQEIIMAPLFFRLLKAFPNQIKIFDTLDFFTNVLAV